MYVFRLGPFITLADRNNSGFDKDHNSVWGKLHRVEDVKIEWHGELRSPRPIAASDLFCCSPIE